MTCPKCNKEIPQGAAYCPWCGKKLIAEPRRRRKRANGTGTISRLSGNRRKPWCARKSGCFIGAFSTYAEAQKALERITDVQVTERFNLTFAEVYDLWLKEHSREISEKLLANYRLAFSQCPQLHAEKIRTLRHSDYQSAIIRLEERGMSRSYCNKLKSLLHQVCAYAVKEGITASNHAADLSTVAVQKSTRKIFTEQDIAAIRASKLPAASVALILISCGCRPGELFSAPLSACMPDHILWGSKTKKGKNRVIPIGNDGLEAYTEMRKAAEGCPRLIDGYSGQNKTESTFRCRDWKELMTEIGRPDVTPYSCRHTFITRSIRAGMPLIKLESIVGHVDKETTKIYLHLQAEDFVAEVNKTQLVTN